MQIDDRNNKSNLKWIDICRCIYYYVLLLLLLAQKGGDGFACGGARAGGGGASSFGYYTRVSTYIRSSGGCGDAIIIWPALTLPSSLNIYIYVLGTTEVSLCGLCTSPSLPPPYIRRRSACPPTRGRSIQRGRKKKLLPLLVFWTLEHSPRDASSPLGRVDDDEGAAHAHESDRSNYRKRHHRRRRRGSGDPPPRLQIYNMQSKRETTIRERERGGGGGRGLSCCGPLGSGVWLACLLYLYKFIFHFLIIHHD